MTNYIKRAIFSFYLHLTKYDVLVIKKLTYKFGNSVVKKFGRAKYDIKGGSFLLSPLNMIDKSIIARKTHDAEVEEALTSSLVKGGTFIDIGANWGYFTILASKMKDVEVIAFEPSRKELQLLYKHMSLNNSDNIVVFPIGLSRDLSIQRLFYGPDRNTGTNSVVVNNSKGGLDTIFCSLDSLIPEAAYRNIRMIKIDVEGYEVQVMQGMKSILQKINNCKVVVEITPEYLVKAGYDRTHIYSIFIEAGFTFKYGLAIEGQYDEVFSKGELPHSV